MKALLYKLVYSDTVHNAGHSPISVFNELQVAGRNKFGGEPNVHFGELCERRPVVVFSAEGVDGFDGGAVVAGLDFFLPYLECGVWEFSLPPDLCHV